jgi:putative GTP pyrophosphokinase
MYQDRSLDRICRAISGEIENDIAKAGLFFRIFVRAKSPESIKSKKELKGENYYDGVNKKICDIIGVRIVFYFPDDIRLIHERLKLKYQIVEETIDVVNETIFQPVRLNLVCRLPIDVIDEFQQLTSSSLFDTTFEIQLRTVLSEGWHEIDHDLRYKCPNDWDNNRDLARNFNGILATIETSEFAIVSLFDQLCFRHFKLNQLEAMIRTKFRCRFENKSLSTQVLELLTSEDKKDLFKLDRFEVLQYLLNNEFYFPITMDAFIYVVNFKFLRRKYLLEITPSIILVEMQRAES